MWSPSPVELIIILVVVLIVFGPKRLPDLGRSLGRGMREFKESVTGKDKDELPEGSAETSEPTPAAPATPATPAAPAERTPITPAGDQKS
jgi:sec-independent protein translocase protein TatA